MSKHCLYCYKPLPDGNVEFHAKCSRQFFGTATLPVLDYGSEEMEELARDIVVRSVAVTGVQPKLSLTIEPDPGDPKRSRLTIVGLWGSYILKPPTKAFPHLPENEDVTMHLAALFGIQTARHSLLRLKSGELAYITKRFDRQGHTKLSLEDFCQLTETMTADKYRGSMEKVGRHLLRYSSRPGLDANYFFEIALFSFLSGNGDMHLKNFSLLTTPQGEVVLSPAYDLLCTKLALPEDGEEMALTINARKRKLGRGDFDLLGQRLQIPEKALQNIYVKFAKNIKVALSLIDTCFLPDEMKTAYKTLMSERAARIL